MNAPQKRGIFDTLFNFVSGLGTVKDKAYHNQFVFNRLEIPQLEAAYRGDWVARKVVDIPAQDATREWREWQADKSDVKKVESLENSLNLKLKTKNAMIRGRLYGGGMLMLGVRDDDPREPLDPNSVGVGDLKFVHCIGRSQVSTGQIQLDVLDEYYGEPTYYIVSPIGKAPIYVHPSRVVRFVGNELPDITLASDGWGDSILQTLNDAIQNVASASGGIATLIQESKVDVIKIPNLMADLATDDYKNRLTERFTLANSAKSMINALLLDKDEDWERITTQFGGLDALLTLYLLIASGAADIPATRLLGQSARGMNATGEGDAKNYDIRIRADQETIVTPAMQRMDVVLVRSALGTATPQDVTYTWNELSSMSEVGRADVDLKKAQTFKIDFDSGLMDPDVLAKARQAQLVEDDFYPGLDAILEEDETADLDETDPDVASQFGKSAPGSTDPGAIETDPLAKPQDQALNGTQITSITAIVEAVAQKEIPPETAKALIAVSFPFLEEADINKIIDPLASFEAPKPPPPVIAPPGPGGVRPPPVPGKPPAPPGPPALKIVGKDGNLLSVQDLMVERSLYVRRDVVNGKDLVAWARKQGFKTTVPPDELHVTICYSRKPVDWMKAGESMSGDDEGEITIRPGGPRAVEPLGPKGAIVVLFSSSDLQWRHVDIERSAGAEYDFDEYQPHVTITYEKVSPDRLEKMEPYRGKIVLGPEIFEEIQPYDPGDEEETET